MTNEEEADEIVRRLQTAGIVVNDSLTVDIIIYPVHRVNHINTYIIIDPYET